MECKTAGFTKAKEWGESGTDQIPESYLVQVAYYAAIWANDQAEYVGPFFPFLGYSKGNDASANAYQRQNPASNLGTRIKVVPVSEGCSSWVR